MRVDVNVTTAIERTARVRQLEAMFDVPPGERAELSWHADVELPEGWQIGALVGPSGSGKSTLLRSMFGEPDVPAWSDRAVIDDFDRDRDLVEITDACSAVGFNTIPAWMRPHAVLSNGEQFRVDLARLLLESEGLCIIDEFTSVVDRQVAQIGAHAAQKYVRQRRAERPLQLVVATCHYDVIEWLQPDWILEPHTMQLTGRSLQRRPELDVEIYRTTHSTWELFAPFHYLTPDLHRAAACYVLCVDGRPACFAGVLHRPHPKTHNIKGVSRTVTLPDWQGLGLAFVLAETLGAAHKAVGLRLRYYPAHPPFIRSFDRNPLWALCTKPGEAPPNLGGSIRSSFKQGRRQNAVFEWAGPSLDEDTARALLCMS